MDTKLPDGFISQMRELIGEIQSNELCEALMLQPSVAVRLNPRKPCDMPEWLSETKPVSWSENGFYLPVRPQFTFAPQLHGGGFYVQDASSMVYEHIVRKIAGNKPIIYLDACAAPGGKTTAAINVLPEDSLVVANEFVAQRTQILKENIQKWGYPNVIVTNSSTDRLGRIHGLFDIIAVDAPCSGEGMMRKDEEARRQWSESLVSDCASLQWEIVCNLWNSLKEGGYLIYSTCTFNRRENEAMLERICCELDGESVDLGLSGNGGITKGIDTDCCCYRFMPHLTKGEGLFVGVVRKNSSQREWTPRKSKRLNKQVKLPPINCLIKDDWHYFEREGVICGISKQFADILEELSSNAKVVMAGVELVILKGKDFIPQHGLALSTALSLNTFPRIEVELPCAIDYLRREAINLPADTSKGFVIITYKGMPLGFVKNLGNRANNLYPQEWRIRSSYTK